MNSFEELGLDNNILRAIKELKFENPMPVQEKIIPMMLQDEPQDIIALAQTGTGKTAAFGLPIIHKTDTTLRQVQFLVIAPTRELCLQIADDLKDYAIYNKDIKIAAIFGGSSMDRQIQKIKQGAQIISLTKCLIWDLRKNLKQFLKQRQKPEIHFYFLQLCQNLCYQLLIVI